MQYIKKSPNLIRITTDFRYQNLWTYVAQAFNKVDPDRLSQVGPDRLCAEWILKNGGAVAFVQHPGKLFTDYNTLPPESTKLNVLQIDASGSSIMKIGLDHLKSCNSIQSVVLHECGHLESDGLTYLPHIKKTLNLLQVSSCYNLDDQGLLILKEMVKLKKLVMFDLRGVNDLNKVVSELKPHLKECVIEHKV